MEDNVNNTDDHLEHTEAMDLMTEEDNSDPPWYYLPSIALQKVYEYVNVQDRTNMSLVCKNWSHEFSAPCNWTHMQFQFPDRHSPNALLAVLKFSRRYAHLFRHVDIVCNRVCTGLLEQSTNQLRTFCEILAQSSKLKSLHVENLKSLFRWTESYLRSEIVSCLKMLLRSQNYLESLKFEFTNFSKAEAYDILGSISEHNISLREIKLKRFVFETRERDALPDSESDEEGHNINPQHVSSVFEHLHSMKTWSGDYNSVLENIILHLSSLLGEYNGQREYSRWTGSLQKISITCDSWMKEVCRGITPEAWKQLRLAFPKLRADITIHSSSAPKAFLEFVVVKNIPIRYLQFSATGGSRSHFITTLEFFNHLNNCGVNATLEELHLLWEIGGSEEIMTELGEFIKNCPYLKIIAIQMTWPFEFREEVLTSWLESRPTGLETIFLTVTHVPSLEVYDDLLTRAHSYTPILQTIGITFALVLELSRIPQV